MIFNRPCFRFGYSARTAVVAALGLLFTAESGAALAADANNFCVNASGIVRLLLPPATACRTNETLLTINQQGGGGSPTVVDQTGTVIGTLLDLNRVVMDIGGNKVVVSIGTNGLENQMNGFFGTSNIYFTTSNCSGTPYLMGSDFPPLGVFISTNPQTGGTLYYATGAQITGLDQQSYLSSDGTCGLQEQPSVVYLAKSINLDYVTPFSVK
jgi:hypothetical protein